MVAVFREVRRVLRADGTVWLNLGDSYASGSPMGRGGEKMQGARKALFGDDYDPGRTKHGGRPTPAGRADHGVKSKDLVGIPWRVAFALQADGWWLRRDVIWAKPNPMPESVEDRPTSAHEYLFMLTRSERYFYDQVAVREVATATARPETSRQPTGTATQRAAQIARGDDPDKNGRASTLGWNRPTAGRNLRSVWSIATQPYPGAHFATFPEKLVEPCVKAGTSDKGVCPECGAPWRRVVERDGQPMAGPDRKYDRTNPLFATKRNLGATYQAQLNAHPLRTIGWQPSCDHDAAPVPAVVLDPFAGSGTTGRVAQRLGRRAVLIDLNGDYLVQAMARNRDIPLGLESA